MEKDNNECQYFTKEELNTLSLSFLQPVFTIIINMTSILYVFCYNTHLLRLLSGILVYSRKR